MMNEMCMEWLMINSQQGSEGSMYNVQTIE